MQHVRDGERGVQVAVDGELGQRQHLLVAAGLQRHAVLPVEGLEMQTLPPTGAQHVDGAAMLGGQAIGVPIDVVGQGLIAHVDVGPWEGDVQFAAHAHALGLVETVVPGEVVGDEML